MGHKWKLEYFYNTNHSSANDKLLTFLNKNDISPIDCKIIKVGEGYHEYYELFYRTTI